MSIDRSKACLLYTSEELSGKAYSDCKKELGKYLHRENPYIVSNNSYRGNNMQLASVEDAWEELDLYINDEMWDKLDVYKRQGLHFRWCENKIRYSTYTLRALLCLA